jgi:hypothetical protein
VTEASPRARRGLTRVDPIHLGLRNPNLAF